MAQEDAIRDQNHVTSMLLESSSNAGRTITAKGDETTGRLLVDFASGSGNVEGDTASEDKEFVRFNSTTGKIIESPSTDNAAVTATMSDNLDVTWYEATNDGNPVFSYGSSATNRLTIIPSYNSGAQTIEFVEFKSISSSATADHGEFRFSVDETLIATIDDGGIELADAKAYFIDTSNVLSETTLGSSVLASSLTSLGTIATLNAGTGTFSGIVSVDDTTDSTSGTTGSIHTDGGLGVALDLFVGDDILLTDGGVIGITGNEVITFNAAGSINFSGASVDVDGAFTASTITADAGIAGTTGVFTSTVDITGDLTVGVASPDDVQPVFQIRGDADSDAGGDTTEVFQVVLTPAADPTTATWDITSTQSAGYKFDKAVEVVAGGFTVTAGGATITAGDLTIGATSADDVQPSLKIIGDADSDAGGDTDDTLTLKLVPNATPTLATWAFTSTQSSGYTFDKDITFATNDILLGTGTGDKASIILNDSALADESWSGTTAKGTGGATIAVGDVCYLQTSDSRWELVDGILDGTDVGFKLKLGICVLATTDGSATEMLLDGLIASAAFPTFTVGAPVYLDDTAGNLVVAQPTTTNFAIRVVGEAVSATVLHFHPSNDYIVHI